MTSTVRFCLAHVWALCLNLHCAFQQLNLMACKLSAQFLSFHFLSFPVTTSAMMRDAPTVFRDCAAVFKSGITKSGVYSLNLPTMTQPIKVGETFIQPAQRT